jgi:ubiquinone biosynthesis monooxygenase Coq7
VGDWTVRHKASSTTTTTSDVDAVALSSRIQWDWDKIRNQILQNWLQAEAQSSNGITTRARYCCFTRDDGLRAYQDPKANWHWLDRELSSNIAGETGAVYIYKGALAALQHVRTDVSRQAVEFCQEHMTNESKHLQYFQTILPVGKHTRLLPIWKIAGWTLGFLPTVIGGSKALYVTVEAVETFVEEHFQDQIGPLTEQGGSDELVKLLQHCCADEVHHKTDAAKKLLEQSGDHGPYLNAWWVRPWSAIVQRGSAFAAEVARRI